MSRYGDLEKLKNHFKCMIRQVKGDIRAEFEGTNNLVVKVLERVCKDIDIMKSADVAPIVHAHWIVIETGYLTCSHCEKSLYVGGDVKSDTVEIAESGEFVFCPKCGAKMDEKKENK